MNKELLDKKYAKLLVESGVNLQKGQPLNIRVSSDPSCLEFARILSQTAYDLGASFVKVDINDSALTKIRINSEDINELENIQDYKIDEHKYLQSRNICSISLSSYDPNGMKGINPKKFQAFQIAFEKKAGKDIVNYYGSNKGQWCVAGYPNKKWAKLIYPDFDENEAFEKLYLDILSTVHINETNDPVEEWFKHNKTIQNHCDILNKYNFKELHYENSVGTSLVIKLPIGHIWCGGCEYTNNDRKILFNPNMPTEEVFTTPQKDGVNGIVYSTKPLVVSGNLIKDFWIKFINGRITNFDAKIGKEYLKGIIETDEGSHYLGEVALVPYHSPISMSNIVYYSTLFDENASCHLAIGQAYETTVKNTDGKNEEELEKMGINSSVNHVDFMIGSSDLSIIGITFDNQKVQIFKNGDFVI